MNFSEQIVMHNFLIKKNLLKSGKRWDKWNGLIPPTLKK